MHAGLLTADAEAVDTDLTITMLDGDLGAVTDPATPSVLPRADEVCWCGCIVCLAPPTLKADDAR